MILKIILAPFALFALAMFSMATHIVAISLHHRTFWEPTTGMVISAATLCEVTYQPADAVLRQVAARGPCEDVSNAALPAGGTTPRVFMKEFGEVSYTVDGTERRWEGQLSDASLFNVKAGDAVSLIYDPSSPDSIDSDEPLKGWFGGLLIWSCSLAFLVFYGWLFWPKRKSPPGGSASTGPTSGGGRDIMRSGSPSRLDGGASGFGKQPARSGFGRAQPR